MKKRITLLGGDNKPMEGWEYDLTDEVSVRRFDKGSIYWFYNPRINGVLLKQIIARFRPKGSFDWQTEDDWQVTVTFFHDTSRHTAFIGSGKTRREAFQEVRLEIANVKKAINKMKIRKNSLTFYK